MQTMQHITLQMQQLSYILENESCENLEKLPRKQLRQNFESCCEILVVKNLVVNVENRDKKVLLLSGN